MKLFCIPYAGGSRFYFQKLKETLPEAIECELLDYAGHGSRIGEPLSGSFEALIDDADRTIKRLCKQDEPFAVFGYSMGSLVAYQLAGRHSGQASHLFTAAFQPPNLLKEEKYTLNEDAWENFVSKFTVLDHRILEDPRYRKIFLDPLKNDFLLLCRYTPERLESVDCDITVMFGTRDVFGEEINGWRKYTKRSCEIVSFEGGHFFLQEYIKEIAGLIARKLLIQ